MQRIQNTLSMTALNTMCGARSSHSQTTQKRFSAEGVANACYDPTEILHAVRKQLNSGYGCSYAEGDPKNQYAQNDKKPKVI